MKDYLYNTSLPFIREDYPGNRIIDGMFVNEEARAQPTFLKVFQWMFTPNEQRQEKANEDFRINMVEGDGFVSDDRDMVVWLGHASFFIRLNGISILTDPCFRNLPFKKRKTDLPCPVEKIQELDYILISHGHMDHLDLPTLKILYKNNPNVNILSSLSMGLLLRPLEGISFQEAGWYQQYETMDGIAVQYLPAHHWHRRGLMDMNRVLWGSFLIKGGGKSVYFAGDTAYARHFKEIGELSDGIDIAIMPIGAYKPAYIMKDSHTNPEEAVRGFRELGARAFIPMHYGTFDLSDEPMGEPVRITRRLFDTGEIEGELKVPAIGEPVLF